MQSDEGASNVTNLVLSFNILNHVTEAHDTVQQIQQDDFIEQFHPMLSDVYIDSDVYKDGHWDEGLNHDINNLPDKVLVQQDDWCG